MDGTREKLVAIIEEARREAVGTVGSMNNGFAVWYADKLLAAGVAPVQGWIPVTERLLDIAGMSVLVVAVNSYGQKEVVQAFTNYSCPVEFETNVKDYEMIWKTAWKVTHWMPLPDAPKEYCDAES